MRTLRMKNLLKDFWQAQATHSLISLNERRARS